MFKNFCTAHCHVQSLDSGSTPYRFAEREVELGTGYITVTDHGTLEAARPVYDLCAKGGDFNGKLKPILGMEAYFRDDNCPILLESGIERTPDKDKEGNVIQMTFREYFKYAHLTLHALDEPAFYKLVKILSDADFRAEQHGSERKPLFGWKQLEELGAQNMTGTSGCLIGMVGRHLMQNNDPKMAIRYYEKLRSCFKPGNFYVEIMPHVTDKNWKEEVKLTFADGTVQSFAPWKKLRMQGKELAAEDLAKAFHRNPESARKANGKLMAVMENRKFVEREPVEVVSVEHLAGFLQNECRPWCKDGDYQREINRFVYALAQKYGDTVLVTDDSHFAYPEERVVQDVRLMQHGGSWRFAQSHHRMTSDEAWTNFSERLGASRAQFEGWVENTHVWANRFNDFKFTTKPELPTNFYPKDTLGHTMKLVKDYGRMKWDDPVRKERLESEIDLLHRTGTLDLLPYFFIDAEVCDLYARHGLLTGPGRGSAAGLSLAYYLGITHVDPLKYKLSKDRFMTPDRAASGKLPDIDQDLPHRDLLVNPDDPTKGWLKDRFGDCVSQISTNTTMKLKSAIKDVHRAFHKYVSEDIEAICKEFGDPPQGIESHDYVFGYDDAGTWVPGQVEWDKKLQSYIQRFPKEWEAVKLSLGLTKNKSRHACAYVIANKPIDSFIPLMTVGGVRVTQYPHSGVEAAGGVKMDFLVINSLRDIGAALHLIQDRHAPEQDWEISRIPTDHIPTIQTLSGDTIHMLRAIPFKGGFVDVWELPEDPGVFKDICLGKVETVFQLDAPAARQGLRQFMPQGDRLPISSIEDLAAFTALDRPGPLDAFVEGDGQRHNMLVEYANRTKGLGAIGRLSSLDRELPETQGVLVYQEQLQAVFQKTGKTTAIQANDFRQRIGKKKLVEVLAKDKPLFMKGAVETLGQDEADRLWGMMETFGQYGFNKSHAVCYVTIAYACAFLKHHYPLEWWTAVLRHAERKEVDEKFWKYVGGIVKLPDIQFSGPNFEIQGEYIRAPISLVHGIGEKAHKQLMDGMPYADIEEFLGRIEDFKKKNGKTVMKLDKKTQTEVQTFKKAMSPLNDTHIRNLILSGVLDSLFPREIDGLPTLVQDRLKMFEVAAAKVRGLKKYKGTASKYNLESEVERFQHIKAIMPAYHTPLLPMVRRLAPGSFVDGVSRIGPVYVYEQEKHTVVTGKQLEWLTALEILPSQVIKVALPAYVVAQRVFTYKKDGGERTACELVLDADGTRVKFVKWPSKKTGLPAVLRENLVGSVIVCMLSRSDADEPFWLNSVEVIARPLETNKEEESSSP
jgi:DNA polymerase III alpha subunit